MPDLMPQHAVTHAGRVFVALRKSGHVSQSRSPVFHAVTPNCRMSLCADEPGAGSGWAEPPAATVTCPACLRRLARLGRTAERGGGLASPGRAAAFPFILGDQDS